MESGLERIGKNLWEKKKREKHIRGKLRNIFIQRVHYPTQRVAASAWVIRKLFRGKLALTSTIACYTKSGRRHGVITVVTFANRTGKGKGWKSPREGIDVRELFSSAGIYLRLYATRSFIALTSIIIFHSVRLENSQIYERTSGQINTPCGCKGGFGIRGIREWQDAKWTGAVATFHARIGFLRADDPLLVIAKEGKMCEHRSINRHWWAGKINSIPPRAGFRNLSAALRVSKKFRLISYTQQNK